MTRLSDTSALVSLLAGNRIHSGRYATKYRSMLDLEAGRPMLDSCLSVWPHLDELVINRKWCILQEIINSIRHDTRQAVLLGSGLDTLSLELAEIEPTMTIYEVDEEHMDAKAHMIRQAAPDVSDRIQHITASLDIMDHTLHLLDTSGWLSGQPTVFVLEGITYYLSPTTLQNVLTTAGQTADSHIIIEHMIPSDQVSPERAHIPCRVFDTIRQSIPDPIRIEYFDHDTLLEMARQAGCSVVRRHTMHSIEMDRTGANHHFPTVESGWIEVSVLRTG